MTQGLDLIRTDGGPFLSQAATGGLVGGKRCYTQAIVVSRIPVPMVPSSKLHTVAGPLLSVRVRRAVSAIVRAELPCSEEGTAKSALRA